ncbi:MAG: hypothetical protein WCV68_02805 [Candidatus Paceibacterota bacterium]
MKSQKSFFVLSVLFFFFLPLISFAQFVPLGPPCTLDPIPAVRSDGVGSICSYCPSYGTTTPLHLSWDIQGTFKDPVCGLNCWGPSGNQCYNFSPNQLLDGNKKVRSNDLKPKDDVFMLNPPLSATSTGAGTNMQVWCWEKSSPSTTKKSAGIRVVSECNGIAGGGEPCEVPFGDISLDLLVGREVTSITEKDANSWLGIDGQDFCYYTNGTCTTNYNGSGDARDMKDFIVNYQISSHINSEGTTRMQNTSLNIIKKALNTGDIVPILIMGKMHGHNQYPENSLMSHALIVVDIQDLPTKVNFKVLDPNYPSAVNFLFCDKVMLDGDDPSLVKISCPEKYNFGAAFMTDIVVMVIRVGDYFGEPAFDRYKRSHDSFCRSNLGSELCQQTAKQRLAEGKGKWAIPIENVPDGMFYGREKGFCFGWVMAQIKVVYLGDFVGTDYHPGDGKFVGKDCDANHYPLPVKSASTKPQNWLANVWLAWQGIFK